MKSVRHADFQVSNGDRWGVIFDGSSTESRIMNDVVHAVLIGNNEDIT